VSNVTLRSRLRGIPWLRRPIKRMKVVLEYAKDARFLNEHLLDGGTTPTHRQYKIRILIHSVEKGLSHRAPRQFGAAKIEALIELLEQTEGTTRNSTSFVMGVDVIRTWKEFHENHGWSDGHVVQRANNFLREHGSGARQGSSPCEAGERRAGTIDVERTEVPWAAMPFADFLASRHSTRHYSDDGVNDDLISECVRLAQLSPSACNRQMVRLHVIYSEDRKRILFDTLHGTGGIDYDACRLAVVTFDASSLEFYGERNQGYLNAGLFAMTLVYAMHWRGIGSCLLQFGNTFAEERMLVRELGLPAAERIAVGIAFGVEIQRDRVPASVRLPVDEILKRH